MAEPTTRLGLLKPAGGELIKIADLNANADILDASPGVYICTSTTRPAAPFEGQEIFETDTKTHKTRIAGNWVWMSSAADWVGAEAWKAELVAGTNGRTAAAKFISDDIVHLWGYIRKDDASTYAIGDHAGLFRMPTAFRPTATRYMNAMSWINGNAAPYQSTAVARIGLDGNVTFSTTVVSTAFQFNGVYNI